MKREATIRPILMLAILVAAVLAAGYVVLRIQGERREQYLAERYERAVATLANQIQSVIESQVSVFGQAVRRAERLRREGRGRSLHQELRELLEGAAMVYEREAPCELTFAYGGYRAGFCPNPAFALQTEDQSGGHAAALDASVRSPVLVESLLHLCVALPDGSTGETDFCAYAEVGRTFQAYAEGSPLGETDVAVIDAGGEVSFARGPRGPRMNRWPADQPIAASAASSPRPTPAVGAAVWPSLATVQAVARTAAIEIDQEKIWLVTQPVRVSIAPPAELIRIIEGLRAPNGRGRESLVAVPATTVTPPPTGHPEPWVVVAMIPASDLVRRGRAVSSWVVAATTFLLLFGLIMPPVLKLWTLGPRERLRPLDVHFLAASVIGLVGLVTIGLLTVACYAGLRQVADEEIARQAASIRRGFTAWLNQGCSELVAFTDARAAMPRPPNEFLECSDIVQAEPSCRFVPDTCALDVTKCVLRPGYFTWTWPPETGLSTPGPLDTRSSVLDLIVLSDHEGNQVEKWSKGSVTEQINMAPYTSFRDVVPVSHGSPNLRKLDGCPPFAFNVQESPNTARTIALLSMQQDKTRGHETAAIAVLDQTPLAHLTAGADTFAIIKRDGQVLFHRRDRSRIFENFFAECAGCDDLLSAIAVGGRLDTDRRNPFDIEYHGRAQRVAMEPVGHTGYTVLVLRDKEQLRTAIFETFVSAVAIDLAITLGLLALMSTFAGFRDRRAGSWIWPRRGDPGAHVDVLLALLVLVALAVATLGAVDSAPAVIAIGAAALLGATVCFLRARSGSTRQIVCAWTVVLLGIVLFVGATATGSLWGWWSVAPVLALAVGLGWLSPRRLFRSSLRPDALEPSFLAAALLLVVLSAVLPALAAFRDAFENGVARYQASQAVQREAATVPGADFDPPEVQPSRDLPGTIDDLVRGAAQVAQRLVVAAREGLAQGDPALAGRWPRLSSATVAWLPYINRDAIVLRHQKANGGGAVPSLASAVLDPGALPLLLMMALATVAGWVVLRGIARRVFGLNLTDGGASLRTTIERAAGELWLDPSASEVDLVVKQLPHPPWIRAVVDMRAFESVDDLHRRAGWAASAPVVLILHLEHRIDEPAWNTAKLELLEAVLFRGTPKTRLLVFSEIDILAYMSERLRSPGDPANDENYLSSAELDRWSTVLDRLAKRPSNTRPGGPPLPPWLEALLIRECRPTSRLLGVAEEIRQHPPNGTIDESDLYRDLVDRASAHYRMLWSSCTDEERLVLLHLARDGFVSPKSWRIVRRLFVRRLVRWTPAIRLMNESFRRFVETVEDERVVQRWERVGGLSLWRKLQVGLVVSFVVVGFFLYATRPDQLTGMVAFLTAIGGGAATLVQLMSFVRTRSEGAER